MNIIKFKDILKEKEFFNLFPNQFTKPDHIFIGWTKSLEPEPNEDGTPIDLNTWTPTIDYVDGQLINDISEDTNLYAVWKECWIKTDKDEINFKSESQEPIEMEQNLIITTKNLIKDAQIIIDDSLDSEFFTLSTNIISKDAESTELNIKFLPNKDKESYNIKLILRGEGENNNFVFKEIYVHGTAISTPKFEVVFHMPDPATNISIGVYDGDLIPKELIPNKVPSYTEGYDKFVGWIDNLSYKQESAVDPTDLLFNFETPITQNLNLYSIHKKESQDKYYRVINNEDLKDFYNQKYYITADKDNKLYTIGVFNDDKNVFEPKPKEGVFKEDKIKNFEGLNFIFEAESTEPNSNVYIYFIKNDIKYYLQCYSNSSNLACVEETLINSINKNTILWTLNIESEHLPFITLTNVEHNKRIIKYNSGSSRFACYTDASQNMDATQLYKLIDAKISAWKTCEKPAIQMYQKKSVSPRRFIRPDIMNGIDLIPLTPALNNPYYTITFNNNDSIEDKYTQNVDASADVFNHMYKGRYALCPRLTYVSPIYDLKSYIDIERNGISLENNTYQNIFFFDDYKDFVDQQLTNDLNNIKEYEYKNKFVTDDDITIDEVKRFRTWLAESLLELFLFKDDERIVLNYYKGEMNDKTIETMKTIIKPMDNVDILNQNSSASTCGCINNTVTMLTNSITLCNPEDIYRKNIYNLMVEMFREIDFWKEKVLLLPEVIKYLDNIIRLNLPLTHSTYMDEFMDCNCLNEDLQTKYIKLLGKLKECFQLIIDDKIEGRKNYIADTLFEWASKLYEVMRWI